MLIYSANLSKFSWPIICTPLFNILQCLRQYKDENEEEVLKSTHNLYVEQN